MQFLFPFGIVLLFFIYEPIVNNGEWLGSPANIKRANKGWKVHDRVQSFVLRPYTIHELRNQHVSIG